MNTEKQNKSNNFQKVAVVTFLSLAIQSLAYGWLWSEHQEHSGALSGLIIIPLVAIVAGSILVHLVLFLIRKRDYAVPLIASIVFWMLALGIPYAVLVQKEKVENEEVSDWVNSIDSQFRNHVEPLLRKRYGDSIVTIEGGYEINAAIDKFIVGYSYSTDLIIHLNQKLETAPLESDTAFWLQRIELIRPLLNAAESVVLDSIQYSKAIRIYNSKTTRPEYPLELSVEFVCGRRFLSAGYNEAYFDQQFRIEYYSAAIRELPNAQMGMETDNVETEP